MRLLATMILTAIALPLAACQVSASDEANATADSDAVVEPVAAKAADAAPAPAAGDAATKEAAAPAAAAPAAGAGWETITITGYECGDNCYVEYRDARGETTTAMCNTALCNSWFEVQAMPESEKGKRYAVRMGTTQQFDNEYRVMEEDFPAIVEMRPAG